ncbi:hypothetical protein JCM14124_25330 [Humidesulfovibrio idahonensis]
MPRWVSGRAGNAARWEVRTGAAASAFDRCRMARSARILAGSSGSANCAAVQSLSGLPAPDERASPAEDGAGQSKTAIDTNNKVKVVKRERIGPAPCVPKAARIMPAPPAAGPPKRLAAWCGLRLETEGCIWSNGRKRREEGGATR